MDNKDLLNKIDFLEFKQNLLFLKPPQHSAQIFYELTLDDFIEIRNFIKKYISKTETQKEMSIFDFEKQLINIWPPAKSYPLASKLIAKILLDENLYNKLIS